MYESEISHWNAAEMGPRRDVLGQLKESCRKKGMEIGASSHRVEHWFFMGHGREYDSDVREPMERGDFYWPAMPEQNHHDLYSEPMPTEEFLQDWLVRCCEIVDKYRPNIARRSSTSTGGYSTARCGLTCGSSRPITITGQPGGGVTR